MVMFNVIRKYFVKANVNMFKFVGFALCTLPYGITAGRPSV